MGKTEAEYRKEFSNAINTTIAVLLDVRDKQNSSFKEHWDALDVLQRCLPDMKRFVIYFGNKYSNKDVVK